MTPSEPSWGDLFESLCAQMREGFDRLDRSIESLRSSHVSREELEARMSESASDRKRLADRVTVLETGKVATDASINRYKGAMWVMPVLSGVIVGLAVAYGAHLLT